MKKTVIILSVFAFIVSSCGQTTKKKANNELVIEEVQIEQEENDKTAEETLKEFYTQYITACGKMPDETKIKEKFVTEELRRKIDNASLDELDYDPFLNAQYCDKAWLTTLQITQITETEQPDMYKVCFLQGEQIECIILFLVKVNGKYLINDIENLLVEKKDNINPFSVNELELNGTWYLDCNHNEPAFTINDDDLNAYLTIVINQFYIIFEKTSSSKNEILYKFKEMQGHIETEYEPSYHNYNDETVIVISKINQNQIEFKWLGLYNLLTEKREYTENPFDRNQNPVILNKCDRN